MISLLLADGVAELVSQQMLVRVGPAVADMAETRTQEHGEAQADQTEATAQTQQEELEEQVKAVPQEHSLNQTGIFLQAVAAEVDMGTAVQAALVAVAMADVLTVV